MLTISLITTLGGSAEAAMVSVIFPPIFERNSSDRELGNILPWHAITAERKLSRHP